MLTKLTRIVLITLFVLIWTVPAGADLKDFVNAKALQQMQDKCDDQAGNCARKCNKGNKDEACMTKCWKKAATCQRQAWDKSVDTGKMPKNAQKYVNTLEKKQANGIKKCNKTAEKCGSKCKDDKCFHKCSDAWLDCSDKVQKDYSLRNKKLGKMLKGKKP